MRDAHVESLRYRLQPGETWEYVNVPRLEGERDDFRYVLDNRTLTLYMKKNYASAEEAKASAAGFLFTWEVDAGLRLGRGAVRFVYEYAQLIDRIPPPPGTLEVNITGVASVAVVGDVTVRITQRAYPEPPSNMKFTPDLETLWVRYDGYRAKREPLSTMAYFCLTVLETSAGSRAEAARQYNIDSEVLRKLGNLTTNRGDAATARKMRETLVPYTSQEMSWIEQAIGMIIRRVAEIGAGASCAKITMKDLPAL